jgi:hypothetical protein
VRAPFMALSNETNNPIIDIHLENVIVEFSP